MIRFLLHRGAQRFARAMAYDTSYMHAVIDADPRAGMRLSAFSMLSQYRGPAVPVWAGALLASTLDGDCGPCAQLVVDMALQAGAEAEALRLCAIGRADQAGATGLGFRFAQAAIADAPDTDALRAEIIRLQGERAALAAAFAAASGRMYPVLKRGLGFGKTCQSLTFDRQVTELPR